MQNWFKPCGCVNRFPKSNSNDKWLLMFFTLKAQWPHYRKQHWSQGLGLRTWHSLPRKHLFRRAARLCSAKYHGTAFTQSKKTLHFASRPAGLMVAHPLRIQQMWFWSLVLFKQKVPVHVLIMHRRRYHRFARGDSETQTSCNFLMIPD